MTTFASSNGIFLKQFFLALDRMGRLGMKVPLSPATIVRFLVEKQVGHDALLIPA
jgi:hypothetical protein